MKYNVGLKRFNLQQGISKQVFMAIKFINSKKSLENLLYLSDQLKNIINHNKRVGYSMDIIR